MEKAILRHPFPPVYDENSSILILGSFPSVKSRENGFFYGHPRNRFWRVLAAVFRETPPESVAEKKAFLLAHRAALWDVAASCSVEGSADGSISSVSPNDLSAIFEKAQIRAVFLNGKTAERLYKKFSARKYGVPAFCLPSTSPANAARSLEELSEAWSVIKDFI